MEESSPEQVAWAWAGDRAQPDDPCGQHPAAAKIEGIYYRALKVMLAKVFVGQPMHPRRIKRGDQRSLTSYQKDKSLLSTHETPFLLLVQKSVEVIHHFHKIRYET